MPNCKPSTRQLGFKLLAWQRILTSLFLSGMRWPQLKNGYKSIYRMVFLGSSLLIGWITIDCFWFFWNIFIDKAESNREGFICKENWYTIFALRTGGKVAMIKNDLATIRRKVNGSPFWSQFLWANILILGTIQIGSVC